MKFTIDRRELLRAAGLAASCVPQRAIMQAVELLRFEVEKDHCWITGTDLNVAVRSRAELESDEVGIFCTPAHQMVRLLKELPDGEITVNIDENVVLEIGEGIYKLKLEADFSCRKQPEDLGVVIPAQMLRLGKEGVGFAMSKDYDKPATAGIRMRTQEGLVTFTATNGSALAAKAVYEIEAGKAGIFDLGHEFVRYLDYFTDDVRVSANGEAVLLGSESLQVWFPVAAIPLADVDAMFGLEMPAKAEVKGLLAPVKRIGLFAHEFTNDISKTAIYGIRLDFLKTSIAVTAGEDARDVVKAKCTKEGYLKMDVTVIREMLSHLGDEVTIEFNPKTKHGYAYSGGALTYMFSCLK